MIRLLAIASALASLALLPAAAIAAEPQTSLADLEDEVMCTVCGTTLQLSNSPQAQQQRDLINQLVARGKTKEEVKDALVVEYGPEVLALPSSEGFDLAAWIVPIVGILIALVSIVLAARRWRREKPSTSPGASAPLSTSEADRVQTDLRRYDP